MCMACVYIYSSYGPRTERCRLFDQSLARAETQAPWGPARGRTNSHDPCYVHTVRLCASRGPRSPRQCTTPDIIREWSYVSASPTKISTTQKMGSTQRLSFASPLAQYTTAVALSVKCADMVNLWLSGTFEARNVALRSRASGCQPLSNSEARDEMRPHGQQPTQTPGLCRQSRCHYVAIV